MVSFTPTHLLAEHLTKPEGYLVAHGQHGNTNMITNYIPEMSDTQAHSSRLPHRRQGVEAIGITKHLLYFKTHLQHVNVCMRL